MPVLAWGSSRTLSISAYTLNDGNSGNNYAVTTLNNTSGVINPGPFSKYVDTFVGGNTVVAGNSFIFTVQATDSYGNPVSSYSGPSAVTTTLSQSDPLSDFPVAGTLFGSGFGLGLGTLMNAGTYTLTTAGGPFFGTSAPVTVTAASASYFNVAAPATATAGISVSVTVTAHDSYGNVATGYTGTVMLTSTDPSASLGSSYAFTTGAGQDNGVHTFSVTLNTSGSQKIIVTDTTALSPSIFGVSNTMLVNGLNIAAFTPTPTGFTATFNKPILPANLRLYGSANAVADVTMTGAGLGAIHGSLMIDPTNKIVTFKTTSAYLELLNSLHGSNDSVVLPDGTYTVTLRSGTGTSGFVDALGASLDGANNGGHGNFTTTFTTHYQANKTPVLGIPDFARGPDRNTPIEVPNNGAAGIPITLYNAANVTDVTFTLNYNASLLNISGTVFGASSDASDPAATLTLVSNAGGVATFHYADANPQSATPTNPLVLGDIMAVVPSGTGAPALGLYQVKEQLQLGSIIINQGAVTDAAAANGVHVNAYFGDVNGDKVINGLDKLAANTIATGGGTGFSAYAQLDPALIGDVAGDISVDAGDVSTLDAYVAQLAPGQIPMPPTQLPLNNPNYVNPNTIHSPNAADPTLSLSQTHVPRTADSSSIVNVAVMIDDPHPGGSTGLSQSTLALTYDPSIVSVASGDITLGSVPTQGTGWHISSVVDQTTGQIGIQLYSATPITATQAGSLINITFHVASSVTVQATAVQLVNAATPYGQWFGTGLADSQGGLILGPGIDQLLLPTGFVPVSAATSNSPVSTDAARRTNQPVLVDALVKNDSLGTAEAPVITDFEEGEKVHGISASLLANRSLGFPTNVVSPPGGQTFLIGNLPLLNTLLYWNSPAQLMAEQVFLTLARSTIAPAYFDLARESLSNIIWNEASDPDWLNASNQPQAVGREIDTFAGPLEQAFNRQEPLHVSAVDKAFADPANNRDEFGDD